MQPILRRRLWILPSAALLLLAGGADASVLHFSDVTEAAGVFVIHNTSGFANADYTGGGAVGDFNNDGWQDLFVISGGNGSVPDHLFINNGDGTFSDQSFFWGLSAVHRGKGAAVGDFNGDGWLDIYETSAGPPGGGGMTGQHRLYRNNGNGSFTNVAASAGVNFTTTSGEDGFGATFGDYDLDGDLDLFVAGFANNNAGNHLFRNDGDETFTDVTDEIGLFDNTPISMRSFAPRLVDMDGDRYPDLLLASDFGTSRYFRNDRDGTFTDFTSHTGTSLEENGMGNAVGDWNGDGLPDWYVTSIYQPGIGWTGNKLYLNTGGHTYDEVAAASGVDDGGYGWAALAVDFNHDGLLDIAETNGGSSSSGEFGGEQSYLWIQNDFDNFDEMAIADGFWHFGRGRGMASFDYDNDGDLDVVIFAYNERLYLYENELTGDDDVNWLRIFLDTSGRPGLAPNGYGAVVSIVVDGVTQTRFMTSGDSFLSHSELSAHFGVGTATVIDTLRVDWPDGSSTTAADVAVNQTLTIAPGGACAGDLDMSGDVGFSDVLALLGVWGPCTDCPADLNGDGTVGFADLLQLLGVWGNCG